MKSSWALPLILLVATFPGCSRNQDSAVRATSLQRPITPIDSATAGAITGTVKIEGVIPAAGKIDMSADAACGSRPNFNEAVVANNGDLANTFVYVKSGLGDRGFAIPRQALEIRQHGCRYEPHVAGVMTGQSVEFVNEDQTTHNIHEMPRSGGQWNESQMSNSDPIIKTFVRAEIMIPVKCNQHPWMRMYLNVVDNPFFAVTGTEGRFEIKGLPPGTYTIAAVQEKLGEQQTTLTIGPKESKIVDFTFQYRQ